MTRDLSALGWSLILTTKVAGYSVAGLILRRRYPISRSRVIALAALRSVIGLGVGIGLLLGLVRVLGATGLGAWGLPATLAAFLVVRFVHWTLFLRLAFVSVDARERFRLAGRATALSFALDLVAACVVYFTPWAWTITSMTGFGF